MNFLIRRGVFSHTTDRNPRRRSRLAGLMLLLIALALVRAPSSAAPDIDSDSDGLPDGWETTAGRAYLCDPRHADLLVYAVERTTMTAKVNETIARATSFFGALNVNNPDGQRGIRLHVIRGPKTTRSESYTDLMAIYLPPALKGRAHFHVFSDDPGGQTNGNASISGVSDIGWNSFVHELGHQLGLNHEGIGFKIQSPLHTSLMNYNYETMFNGSENQVHFSDGRFARLRMRETNLDETLPFPITSLEFLAKDPYHFALRAVGANTEVDWNRNGIFGEKGVRADINYASGTWLGDRGNVEAIATAPAGAYQGHDFYVAYGVSPAANSLTRIVNRSAQSAPPGRGGPLPGPNRAIVLRKRIGNRWSARIATGLTNVIGDPTLVVLRGILWVAASDPTGVKVVALRPSGDDARPDDDLHVTFPSRPPRQPTLAVLDDHLFLFLREAGSNRVLYIPYSGTGHTWGEEGDTGLHSRTAAGVAWHPVRHQAVLVLTADANAPFRLAAYFRGITSGRLHATGDWEWIGGADGGTASMSRPAVLIDPSRDAGPNGRIYAYYVASQPNLPAFISMQVADRSFHGGWLEKSAYDEWSLTRSAPAAAFNQNGDITYCYRDQSDSVLKCSFNGTGIQQDEMGDFDEVTFIRTQGLKQSLGR